MHRNKFKTSRGLPPENSLVHNLSMRKASDVIYSQLSRGVNILLHIKARL